MSAGNTDDLRKTVYASLFAALIAAGAFISMPVGPVPIVLQNMFVLMSGVLLGWKWGVVSVLVYLFAGLIGFPVFSAGRGGLAHVLGPTGGYLVSYIPAVIATGALSPISRGANPGRSRKVLSNIFVMIIGSILIYSVGVPWLKLVTGLSWGKAISAGMLPFIIGDTLKVIAGGYISELIRPLLKR